MNALDVRIYAIQRRPGRRRQFEIRWRAAGRAWSRSFTARALAGGFRAGLARAAPLLIRCGRTPAENWLCPGLFVRHDGGVLDLTDYELVWPPDLFVAEARRILGRPGLGQEAFDLLLREAFRDGNAAEDVSSLTTRSAFGSDRTPRSLSELMAELTASAHQIRRSFAPQPYWPQRHGQEVPGTYLDGNGARRGFADLVQALEGRGYLDQVFPRPCVDGDDEPEVDPSAELQKRLNVPGLWPLAPDEWDDDIFYGLIEVYHDLVSRPELSQPLSMRMALQSFRYDYRAGSVPVEGERPAQGSRYWLPAGGPR